MSDLEVVYNSDQEVLENHSKLIEAVAQLDKKQRVNKAERSEPTLEVSEFHLVKSGITNKDAVQVRDLVKSLGQRGYQSQVAKKLQSVQRKSKVISKPLEKPAAEKIKKKCGFDRTLKDLSRWNAVVAKNRTSTHLSFPLMIPKQKLKLDSPADFINGLRLKSDLQQKIEELDSKPKDPLPEEDNKKDNPEVTLQEMKKTRSEIAKHRARQSYQEAKAQRQRKIKSKKFHRVERKKKDKEQLIEFEKLQKSNPEEALEKLKQLDKSCAEERMSLRHKSTGQWAKNKQIRAKYNKDTRQELAEQLSIGRQLTQKIRKSAVDNSDDEPLLAFLEENQEELCNNKKTESEVDEFIASCRRYFDTKKKEEGTVTKVDSESKSSVNKDKLDCISQISSKQNKAKSKGILNGHTKEIDRKPLKIPNSGADGKNMLNDAQKWVTDKFLRETYEDDDVEKELKKENDTITSVATFKSKKTKKSVKSDKKASKKANTNCTETSSEIASKKKKAKLCNEKNEVKVKNKRNADATSTWHVEELLCNKETGSKTLKAIDVDDMFDSVEENIKHKVNLRLQKIKKKFEMEDKVNKGKKENNKGSEDYVPDLEFNNSKQKPMLDLPLEETTSRETSQQNTALTNLKTVINTEQELTNKSNNQAGEINLQTNVKPKHLKTKMPDLDVDGEDELEDNEQEEENDHRFIDEIFEDDDVEEEFKKEKEQEIKNSQPEDINTALPGWGRWAGTNIKEKKVRRKNRRFIQKFPKDVPRKDENKGDVIIFEGGNQKLKDHLVSELPYPFTTVKDFEASMRAPLGRTFVPENAHRRLIEPSVVTKSGQVIEPMTEDVLLKTQPTAAVKRRIDKQKKNSMKNNNKKMRMEYIDVK